VSRSRQICFLAFLLLAPFRLVAQEGDLEDEFALLEDALAADEVRSASKHRQSIFWSPSAITVLTRDDIRSSGAATLSDLLRRVPGFDVYEAKCSYPLVGARALTEESNNLVLVLVDGREILAEFTGITFWTALPVDLEDIERIEVIRGPGSTLYGANAFAAVLNITTMSDRPVAHAGFTLMGGEEGFYHLMGRAGDSWSLWDGTMSFGLSVGMDGKRSPSDSRDKLLSVYRAQGHLRYRRGRSLDLSVFAGVVPGGGLFYTHIGDMRITEALNYWLMGRAELALGEITRLKTQLYLNNWEGNFHSRSSYSAYNIWIATPPDFFLDSPTIDGQIQLDLHISEDLLLIGGANLRYVTLDCENYVPSNLSEFRGAVFVHAQWTLADTLQFTGGIRMDRSTEIEPAISPRAVVVFRPRSNHAFRLGYGLAFRKPSLYESQVHPKTFDFNPATPEIVEKMETSIGNDDLTNEKVHSLEAGWRARFLEERLQVSVDLFFNVYQDTISFKVDIQERLGMPDIVNSTLQYVNDDGETYAVGGEAELAWRLDEEWSVWANLGVRRVTKADSGERAASEPTLRANLGGRYSPAGGLIADLTLHYVSTYKPLMTDPENIFDEREPFPLGNTLLALGRLGYRFALEKDRSLEGGLTVRAPIGLPFREYPGASIQRTVQSITTSDFGGELLMRWVSLYLRGSF
jgi:iron complex outermembrane receptor protein